jgi:Uri superfamily endonuclease
VTDRARIFKHRRTEEIYTYVGTAVRTFAKKPDRVYVVYTIREDDRWHLMNAEQFFNGDLQEQM